MIVARSSEQKKLRDSLNVNEAQFIAIYGRRRIGKTYLVNKTYENEMVFSHAGIYNGTYKEQLQAFTNKLDYYGLKNFEKPKNWIDAFYLLVKLIDQSKKDKKVIFLDELSWMSTKNSGFTKALENFWNSYMSNRNDIILIVCASATSWIIDNIIHNKGGLHNRVTYSINLKQFSLCEVEEYFQKKKIDFTRRQLIELYMILGGVPYYLNLIQKDLSLASNIDKLFVGDSAILKNENDYLYRGLFENPEGYIKIVKALANGTKAGMTRNDLIKASKQTENGNFSKKIEELEQCGIIRIYNPFGKSKKTSIIQLIDNFTLFYYKFLASNPNDENFFSSIINTSKWISWSGLAFERVCLEHIKQIKTALEIGGVKTEVCSFYTTKNEENGIYGSQIDLLIVRNDETINLCEMKFSNKPYLVTAKDIEKMEIKRSDLMNITKTKYSIIPTLIVSPDAARNAYSNEFPSIVTSDDLFKY